MLCMLRIFEVSLRQFTMRIARTASISSTAVQSRSGCVRCVWGLLGVIVRVLACCADVAVVSHRLGMRRVMDCGIDLLLVAIAIPEAACQRTSCTSLAVSTSDEDC
jgi:hypothetical protein